MSESDILQEVGSLTKGQEVLEQKVLDLEQDQDEARDIMSAILVQLKVVPNEVHKKHHDLMKEMIEKARARKEFWRDLKLYMAQKGVWHAILVIGALTVLFWNSDLALKLVYKLFNLKGK